MDEVGRLFVEARLLTEDFGLCRPSDIVANQDRRFVFYTVNTRPYVRKTCKKITLNRHCEWIIMNNGNIYLCNDALNTFLLIGILL